jgi:type IX secretion system PorP/SprF family membrane protein
MKAIKTILIASLIIASHNCLAQQESVFSIYKHHMNIINPAYAGVDNITLLTGTIRRQWVGIKEAPEAQAISFGTGMGHNIGLGISMINDKTFIEKQTSFGLDISYNLKVSPNSNLYLGIKAGGNYYDINTAGLKTYTLETDVALPSVNQFNPNVGFGMLLKNKNYYISFSVPKLLKTEVAQNRENYVSVATDKPNVYLSGGYDIKLNTVGSMVFKPSFMFRYVNEFPVTLDINTMVQVHQNFEMGVMYRTNKTFAGIVDFILSKRLLVGYAYEVNTNPDLASANVSNEFIFRFRF